MDKRFNLKGLAFLQSASKSLSAHNDNTLLAGNNFKRIILQDASQVRMPPQNSDHYTGISNQWGAKSSAKIDLTKGALSGDLVMINLDHGTHQDRIFAKDIYEHVNPQDLVMRDMGYFSTEGFQTIDKKGAFYISRVPSNTSLTLLNGTALEKYLKSLPEDHECVDLEVLVSQKNPIKTRLVAIRCSEEVTSQRRAKAKKHRQKMKVQANKYTLQREGWTLFITNLSLDDFSAPKIHQLYAQRWGVDIQFRALNLIPRTLHLA